MGSQNSIPRKLSPVPSSSLKTKASSQATRHSTRQTASHSSVSQISHNPEPIKKAPQPVPMPPPKEASPEKRTRKSTGSSGLMLPPAIPQHRLTGEGSGKAYTGNIGESTKPTRFTETFATLGTSQPWKGKQIGFVDVDGVTEVDPVITEEEPEEFGNHAVASRSTLQKPPKVEPPKQQVPSKQQIATKPGPRPLGTKRSDSSGSHHSSSSQSAQVTALYLRNDLPHRVQLHGNLERRREGKQFTGTRKP